jgi:transposase-like protein
VRRSPAVRSHVDRSAFAGLRFPPEVITVAVRWYLRYGLSYRDVEESLAERGVEVDHVTVYRWGSGYPWRTGLRSAGGAVGRSCRSR